MDWQRAIKEERAALMRIAALLCALAGLAELAAGRSAAVRGFLLWLLRHAEAVAIDFVMDDPDMQFASMPGIPSNGGAAEARRLAISLRALARSLELQARLMLVMRCEDGGAAEPVPFRGMPAIRGIADALSMLVAVAWWTAHPAPDTS